MVMKVYIIIFVQILCFCQICCYLVFVWNCEVVVDELEVGVVVDVVIGLVDDMDFDSFFVYFIVEIDEVLSNKVYGVYVLEGICDEVEKECFLCFDEFMNDQLVIGCWYLVCKKCILDFMQYELDRGVVL